MVKILPLIPGLKLFINVEGKKEGREGEEVSLSVPFPLPLNFSSSIDIPDPGKVVTAGYGGTRGHAAVLPIALLFSRSTPWALPSSSSAM